TPAVPQDGRRFLAAVYPRIMRAAWDAVPSVPAALSDADDLVAELAVRGPFASYLQRVDDDTYAVDVSWMTGYEVVAGLARPGGRSTFAVRDNRLVTEALDTDRMAYLAALNEDLTTFRHNLSVHLAMLTPFAVASTNHLDVTHPVRRLLHHCFNTVLI